MFKKYLLIFLILVQSCYALSVELDYSTLGPEQNFLGYIKIDPGIYNSNSEIKVSTTDSSDSKKLKDVIDCDEIDCTGVLDYYISSGATESTITGTDILTGIRIPEDTTSISSAHFDIEPANPPDYPDTPIIDIGNDNEPEWIYPGKATNTFSTTFSGPEVPNPIESVEIQSSGNCQKLLLQKSMQYKIQAWIKTTQIIPPTLDVFISGIVDGNCNQPTQNWAWTECTIDLEEPLETDYYYVCLTSSSPGNYLASNSSAQNPQGYANCLINCQPVNKDYIIQAKGADYISKLTEKVTYSISNTYGGEYLYQTFIYYYNDCIFNNGYCTIPIRVNSNNNKTIKLSNLEYKITQIDTAIKNKFLSSVTKVSGEGMVTFYYPVLIPLSNFDTKTPSELDKYELKVEFNNQITTVNYNVAELPTAKISLSKEKAVVFEKISFDASQSFSPKNNSLKFTWDFGDNTTKLGMLVDHYYLKPGTYTITLNVTDTITNISSLPVKKPIEIYSSEVEISQLISSTLNKLENAISYMNSASTETSEIYTDLNFDQKLNQAKSKLSYYKTTSLTQTQLSKIRSEIDEILSTLPSKISITQTLNIQLYLSYEDVSQIYPTKATSFKETVHDLNSRITTKAEAKLLHINYLSDNTEDFILVKKTITPKNALKDVSIIEVIPKTLATPETLEFSNLEPEITTSQDYLEAKIPFTTLESSIPTVLIYKLPSLDIDLIKDTKTIILPTDLKEKDIPFECGNGICNPGEDYLSCPEDCRCGNKICEPGENKKNCPQDCKKTSLLLIILLLLFVAGITGFSYYIYKNPSLAEQLKINGLIKKIEKLFKRNPFSSEAELKRIITFIKNSKQKNIPIIKIRKALTDKGWSQEKINYAIKKAK